MEIRNKKWSIAKFNEIRREVLNQWPTGKEVNFEEAVKYHRNLPEVQVMTNKLREAKVKGITLIQPRAGVALIDEHITLLKFLRQEGKADLLPTTIDSYTRQNSTKKLKMESRKARKQADPY